MFLIIIVLSVTVLVISCSSSDDSTSTTATSATTHLTPSSCVDNETVVGEIAEINRVSVSGVYSMTWGGATTAGGCISNSSALSQFGIAALDSTVSSLSKRIYVTSNSTITETTSLYTDSSCSDYVAFFQQSKDNVTAGDNITITNPPSGYPGAGTRITFTDNGWCIYAGTAGTLNWINGMTGGSISVTQGELKEVDGNPGSVKHGIFTLLDNVTSDHWLYTPGWDGSSALDNHSSQGDMMYNDNASS